MRSDNFGELCSGIKNVKVSSFYEQNKQTYFDKFEKINSQAIYLVCYESKSFLFRKGIRELLGYDSTQFRFDNLHTMIHPEDVRQVIRISNTAVKLGLLNGVGTEDCLHISFRIKHASGRYIIVERTSGFYEVDKNQMIKSTYSILRKDSLSTSFIGVRFKWDSEKTSNERFIKYLKSENSSKLSNRELELLSLFAKGLKNDFIAKRMHISCETVRSHKKNMMRKLGCSDSNELVLYYHENLQVF